MIVADKGQVLAGDYTILSPNILLHKQSQKLFKSSNFKPWAIFQQQSLQSAKVVTLTPFNPIFLVIKQAEVILSRCDNKMKQLEDIFSSNLLKLFKQQIVSICDAVQAGQDIYYRINENKILDILQNKFQLLANGLSNSKIQLQVTKLQKEGDLLPFQLYAVDIMKQDVSKDLMDKLTKDRLKIEVPIFKPVFLDQYKEQAQPYNPQSVKKKVTSQEPKLSAKQQHLKKQAKQTHSITSFFKKKEQNQPQPEVKQL